jgi:uracil phosphoribosyltransferase
MVHNIGENNSLFNEFVREIRDENIQKDRFRFRRNLERVSEIMAYEISKKLNYDEAEITTPLGIAKLNVLNEYPVIASILRAGLPMHNGFLNYFDKSDNVFISAFRKYEKDGTFDITFEHISGPSLDKRPIILTDPMLATGASIVLAYKALLGKGKPAHVHIACLIASKEGIEHIISKLGEKNITIWVGAIDDELTVKSYIVPGLGDAGDLAYGVKE